MVKPKCRKRHFFAACVKGFALVSNRLRLQHTGMLTARQSSVYNR